MGRILTSIATYALLLLGLTSSATGLLSHYIDHLSIMFYIAEFAPLWLLWSTFIGSSLALCISINKKFGALMSWLVSFKEPTRRKRTDNDVEDRIDREAA